MRGIPEYWIIDPQSKTVIVRSGPTAGGYAQSQKFWGGEAVASTLPELANLQLTAQEILEPEGGKA